MKICVNHFHKGELVCLDKKKNNLLIEKFDCLLSQAISAKDMALKIKEILVRLIRVSKNHRFHQSFDLTR